MDDFINEPLSEDDEAFAIQQRAVEQALEKAREALNTPSLTTICLECGEEIGAARLKAIPSACHCIDCQQYLEKHGQRIERNQPLGGERLTK